MGIAKHKAGREKGISPWSAECRVQIAEQLNLHSALSGHPMPFSSPPPYTTTVGWLPYVPGWTFMQMHDCGFKE